MYEFIRKNLALMRLVRGYRLFKHRPAWAGVLRSDKKIWDNALAHTLGQRILIPTSVGAFLAGTSLETLLAVSLTLRGAKVELLLCDGVLPACFDCMIGSSISEEELCKRGVCSYLCKSCFRPANKVYKSLGLPVHYYSQCITEEERKQAKDTAQQTVYGEIPGFILEGCAIGEHALAGALRFYAKGQLGRSSNEEYILRKFFEGGLLTYYAIRRLLSDGRYFTTAVFHHGIYSPMGIIGEVCRKNGVRVINWNPAYRKQCFVFTHGQTYHHALMLEPVEAWETMPWDTKRRDSILRYLKSRWYGSNDWIWFHEKPQFNAALIEKKFGVDFSRPVIGMLTSVIWDAQLHYPKNIFADMVEWLKETIQYFSSRSNLQLLIRVHPAEIRGTISSRQKVVDEIKRIFPLLPPNVIVIPPENNISTYVLMERCDSVIIYGTKTGVELTSMGIPVIVAGEAWIKNKGITIDPASKAEYFSLLGTLPLLRRMPPEAVERAIRYAYHFFYRRAVPIKAVRRSRSGLKGAPYEVAISRLAELMPGYDKGLDVICDGILNNTPFIFEPDGSNT